MTQTFKPQLTKIDYLSFTFCPDELARIRTQAKLLMQTKKYKSYKEAYNALLCSELWDENASDDFEITQSETQVQSYADTSEHFNELFSSVRVQSVESMTDEERTEYFKVNIKKTRKYKVLTTLIENDLSRFMHWLNTEVATKSDRLTSDEMPWSYKMGSGGLYSYEKSAQLYRHGVNSGVIAWGANNGGIMISFTGVGCSGIDIPKLYTLLCKMPHVRITRLDIAYDDYKGNRDFNYWLEQVEDGGFCKTNQAPKFRIIQAGELVKNGNKWEMIADAGNTFYIGQRESGKMARFYEKGKQMKSENYPNWTRAELELRNVDREISLNALVNHDAVFAAAYPAFEFLTQERLEVKTTSRQRMNDKKEATIATIARLEKYARIGYGKLINFMVQVQELTPDQVISKLTEGLQPWDFPQSIEQLAVLPPNQVRTST